MYKKHLDNLLIMTFYSFQKERIQLLILCFFALFLFSCGEDDVPHTVDSTLEPYLDRFLAEGAKQGKNLNIDKNGGLIMEFADLTPPTIGLCYPSLPVRIQIDRKYWKDTENSANRENLRENVVFHELAHGFLGRKHRNDSLPNNEWTSMMCGEPQVNGRNWAVNFNGRRKDYYLKELFDVNTPIPEWSLPQTFDGDKRAANPFKSEDYTFEYSKGGTINNDLFYKIEDGFCTYYCTGIQNQLFFILSKEQRADLTGLIKNDFYFEVNIYASFDNSGVTGLSAGCMTDRNKSYNYVSISHDDRAYPYHSDCFAPFAEVSVRDKFKKGEENKLALCKRGEELFFYINDQLVYRNDYNYKLDFYNDFGIIVPAKGSISVRNYALYSSDVNTLLRSKQLATDNPYTYTIPLPGVNYSK